MMRRAALCLLAVAVSSCSTLVRDEVAAPPSGGNVDMRTGTGLVVSLPPDPANGYGWQLRSASPNLALVGGPDYTPAPKPAGLVGVSDTTAFRFRAMAPGPGSLEFVWAVPPGQASPPDKVVRYDVQVAPSIWLPSNLFGTLGMNSVRGGDYAPAQDAVPVKASASLPPSSAATTPTTPTTPAQAPAGSSPPSDVKYWSN